MTKTRGAVDLGGWEPHAGQAEMLRASHGNRVVCVAVGRRWGKTEGAKFAVLDHAAWAEGRLYRAAYCAPTYKRAKPVYEEFRDTTKGLWERKSDTDLMLRLRPMSVTLPGGRVIANRGGEIHFWSLEEHDNLRGTGMDLIVVDECADVEERAYYATLVPMTLDTGGRFLLIGTPKRVGVGFVWFRTEWNKGLDRVKWPDHYSMTGPSLGNPWLSKAQYEVLVADCPDELTRREEYGAEWLDETGAVFEKLRVAFSVEAEERSGVEWVARGMVVPRGAQFVIGADFARWGDFTVFSVWRRDTREQVCVVRVREEEFEDQLERLHVLRDRYGKGLIVADETGLGAPVVERLRRRYGDGVVGRKWSSSEQKEQDVTRGRLLFQREGWKFLNVPWQFAEFQNYTRVKLEASGRWRYTAPEGGNDDAVAAACLVSPYLYEAQEVRVKQERKEEVFSCEWIDRMARWRRSVQARAARWVR